MGEVETVKTTSSTSWKVQVVKAVLSALAGLAVSKLVETTVDKVVTTKSTETSES